MVRGALKDNSNQNRYQLWRIWDEKKPLLLYILLNPSLANEVFDDKTVRRLIGFTKKFSFGGFYLGNLHSTITPYPDPDKFVADDLTNINHIRMMHQKCDQVIFGWGNLGKCPLWLEKMIKKPLCFGINKNGQFLSVTKQVNTLYYK